MASCVVTRYFVLILLVVIERIESKCVVNKISHYCDSIEDLNGNVSLLKEVVITKETGNLEEFKPVISENAKNIERLEIIKAINNITEDAFKNLPSLQYLMFKKNQLKDIHIGVFRNLNVKYLDFYESGIETIALGAFSNLPKLQSIGFSYNNLTQITNNVFNNLTINKLTLSNNQIWKIEKFALANMPNLTKLYLDNNNLSTFIAQECLNYGGHLERLWLHRNNLTQITSYMLEGLMHLKVLNLGFNFISSIEPQTFAETPNLTTLVLSHNLLKVISGNILSTSGLNELKILYLDHNRLTYLSSNFFFKLHALRLASIGGNPWQCPCLDLVLRWLVDNNVKLKCDKDYFNGERPVCVIPKINICTYSYEEEHYEHFHNYNSLYPPSPFCIL